MRARTPGLIIAASTVLLAGCAHHSRSANATSGPWSFSVQGELPDSDVAQIVTLIRRIPQIEHEIVWIEVQNSDSIEVYTGHIYGPLAGGGNVVTLKKRKNKWSVVGDPRMSHWNA